MVIILLKLSKSYADPKIVCSLCKLTELAGVVEMETEPKRSPLQNLRTLRQVLAIFMNLHHYH